MTMSPAGHLVGTLMLCMVRLEQLRRRRHQYLLHGYEISFKASNEENNQERREIG